MTHNRNFRKSVRGLAEQKGVNYTEALKELTATQNESTQPERFPYLEDDVLYLGRMETGQSDDLRIDDKLVTWDFNYTGCFLLDDKTEPGKNFKAIKIARVLAEKYTVKIFTSDPQFWSQQSNLVCDYESLFAHLESDLSLTTERQIVIIDLPQDYLPSWTQDLLCTAIRTGRSKLVNTIFVGRKFTTDLSILQVLDNLQ